jgi:hypothetical protein
MSEKMITKGRSRQAAVLKKAAADNVLRRVETDYWLSEPVTETIARGTPVSRDHAPYTMGAKRTKVKMSWFKDADGCFFASIPDSVAYESRGYESRREPWRFRVRGNTLVYENDHKNRTFAVLQCVEREGYSAIEWLIDPGILPEVYCHALDFLGLDFNNPKSFSAVTAERRSLFKCLRSGERELLRKAAKRCRNRPGKAERMAARNAQNDVGLPRQSFRLA